METTKFITVEKLTPGFPPDFYHLYDPPERIYVRGNAKLIAEQPLFIGIVGTRKADAAARHLARETAKLLTQAGCIVVSGLAFGVDSEAHRGALDAGGKTVAILGSGIDDKHIMPPSHLGIARQILEMKGTVLSEFPPGTMGGKYTFPKRNRLIAALSKALIVIQAPQGSGALITADFAFQLGRDVAVFPGSAMDQGWSGSNRLFQQSAHPLCEPADALEWLKLGVGQSILPLKPRLQSKTESVMNCLNSGPKSNSELATDLHLPVHELMSRLTEAELAGRIRQIDGKWMKVV